MTVTIFLTLLVTLAFGIPSINREKQSYLGGTLRSLLEGLTEEDKTDVVLIVFIGDVSTLAKLYVHNLTLHIIRFVSIFLHAKV